MPITTDIPLFPLREYVLFPTGQLRLNVFEPRYLELIANCEDTDTGFGVVLLQEGSEVQREDSDEKQIPAEVGTLASLVQVTKRDNGQLSVLARGGAKFRVIDYWTEPNDLMMAQVEFLPADKQPTTELSDQDRELFSAFLRGSYTWEEAFAQDVELEMLLNSVITSTLTAPISQNLLEMSDLDERFNVVRHFLREWHQLTEMNE